MKILFIEDSESDIDAFKTSMNLYNQKNANIEMVQIQSIDDFDKIKETVVDYDAVIVDIKLKDKDGRSNMDIDAGNTIIETIEKSMQNIPIYIYTGTPANITHRSKFVIKQYTKGEADYTTVIDHAYKLYNTGLMQIIGGKGKIYELIQKIYKENIIENLDQWIEYNATGKNTGDILSRYIATCISANLENSCEAVKEEMFMIPPAGINWKTGSIIKDNDSEDLFVILTPDCDLVLRNVPKNEKTKEEKKPKTDYVLLCRMQSDFSKFEKDMNNLFSYDTKFSYIYYLPKNTEIKYSTFLNFREVFSIPYTDKEKYKKIAQILPEFTKEITQKFSTYYSRQGQPDFDKKLTQKEFESLIKNVTITNI
jgi:hypothetical protein